MHPAGPLPPPPNRSCPSPSLVQCSSPSPPLIQQQQQQHVIYGPITTIQPCPANIHPHCIYSGVQRNHGLTGTSGCLVNQVNAVPMRHAKMTKWQAKSKPARGHHPNHHQQSHQQYCQPFQHQQTHVQTPLPYITKPLVLFDQCQTNQSTPGISPSAASFVVASSTFTHGPYGPGDPYTPGSGLTLIPQTYFKPPEVAQAFCILPERPQAAHHHQHNFGAHVPGSYYNISAANASNLQTINSKPPYYGTIGAYNQIAAGQAAPASPIFQNSPMAYGTSSRDRMPSNVDGQSMSCSRNARVSEESRHEDPSIFRTENTDWPVQTSRETSNNIFETAPAAAVASPKTPASPPPTNRPCSAEIPKTHDERCSDESAASFDFTIEAEKMVSALCNTVSSNELGKDESCGRNAPSPSFGGAAGDNVTNKTNMWFADFCTEYGVTVDQNNRTVSTQTQEDRHDSQRYPEIMRKTIYWGCNEAETILNSSGYRSNAKAAWLANISSATRTALMKSSTCFPIFSGDRAFVQDLINALLRISNGWLVLDNYLNKQLYPSLDVKFDTELTSRFQTWEVVTQDLLRDLVKTLVNIEDNAGANCSTSLETLGFQEHPSNTSFPGDVNLYTDSDLFDFSQFQSEYFSKLKNCDRNDRDSTYTLQYPQQSLNNANFPTFESRQQSQKETKLRSKWTITENLSSNVDGGKTIRDIGCGQNDAGFSGNNRFRVKNSSNTSATKITASSRHSLNAEFFHLQNKVMESMGNTSELERQRWGLKEQQYNFVFGTSRGQNTSGIVPGSCEPIFKFKSAGSSSYENAYTRRCLPRVDSTNPVNQATMSHCTNVNGSVYLVAGTEAALDSAYMGGIGSADHKKAYAEPDYTSNVRIAELNEHSCGSGLVVSATSISSIRTEPVYVGKCSSDQRELAVVPRTKMTLLSQIESGTATADKETKEMTADMSAWFASMRNSNGPRTINCPVEGRKNENISATRASSHPQETSRSAMDLSRQLHMDGNRQLQTLQNMQAIQSQPWNAANLLNSKRTTTNVQRSLDEYDSSEDVRVYMKPGSYNVPKKRHHRKNNRRTDNLASSRGNISNSTPRTHSNRAVYGANYNCGGKNQLSTSVSSLLIASSVQVSTTTTTTSTSIRVPFPAIPIVLPPSNFTPRHSPKILRRVRPLSNKETQQDVAWKAACASAEILLEALNVKATNEIGNNDSQSSSSIKITENDSTPRNRDEQSIDRSSSINENARETGKYTFCDASSYEASEDDSSLTRKFSPDLFAEQNSCDAKHMKHNVKTDTWLIRTFNNASMVSSINARESDHESTLDDSMNSSMQNNRHEYKSVVTSTPEPIKIRSNVKGEESTLAENKLAGNFPEESFTENAGEMENLEQSGSNDHRTPSTNLSISLIDSSAEFIGRATYSETVRRSTGKSSCPSGKTDFCRSRQTRSTVGSIEPTIKSTIVPIPGRRCQRRDNDRARQSVHKSRKTITKKIYKDADEKESEEGRSTVKIVKECTSGNSAGKPLAIKCQTKKKINAGSSGGWTETKSKISERGWSIWYSSRRKQMLSTLALDKLATIHRTVWQMDDAKLLKHPTSSFNGSDGTSEMIEDDRKVNKSPIFLETIGYKLKNRIYHKIEHVMRDFRKTVNNSKLYHKNDTDRIVRIETLSKKLEELFNEHFSNWDVDNTSESPRNNTGLSSSGQSSKCKSPRQQQRKSSSCRLSNSTKKTCATSAKNEC